MSEEPKPENKEREKALQKMKHDSGVWNCRWDFLDEKGNVTNTANGTQTFAFEFGDSVMSIKTEVGELKSKSIALRYFDVVRGKLTWQSVDNTGDHWTFIEDLDGEHSLSLPHPNEDGTTTWLRFQATRETDHEVEVLMELSKDENDWRGIFKMYRDRAT